MSNKVTNRKFTDPALNRYDVMQHIRNLYDIVGVTNTNTFEQNHAVANVVDRIEQIADGSIIKWEGSMEKFLHDKAAGLITSDMICAITDDYYNPNE